MLLEGINSGLGGSKAVHSEFLLLSVPYISKVLCLDICMESKAAVLCCFDVKVGKWRCL